MKSKGFTILFIILGIVSIITLSVILTSISNFIYYIFIEFFDIEAYFFNETNKVITIEEVKEAYQLLINFSIHGGSFNGLGVLKYSEQGISHLEDVKQVYFDLKLLMILSVGFFVMIKIMFDKGTIYSYVKIKNHTPYFYVGFLSIFISLIVLILGVINFDYLFTIFHEIVFKDNYVMSPSINEFVSILPLEFFLLMLIVILTLIIVLSGCFIVLDRKIIRKEEKYECQVSCN